MDKKTAWGVFAVVSLVLLTAAATIFLGFQLTDWGQLAPEDVTPSALKYL